MEEKLVFCVSVISGENDLYGPEWKEIAANRSLIDLFLQVCDTRIVGQQVQVLVSKERSFLEAAVVQVSSPLKILSKKKQNYIQFVVKADAPVQKDLYSLYQEEMKKTFSKLNILEENGKRRYETSPRPDEPTAIHSLTTRTSFENMTVEEICEEIRKIKSAEVSKNKLTSWVENTSKNTYNRGIDESEKLNWHFDKTQQASNTHEKNEKTLNVSASAEKIKQYTKLTESVKNKLNNTQPPSSSHKNTPKTARISERLSKLAQPRRRTCELTKVNNLQSNHKQLSSSSNGIIQNKNTNKRSSVESKRRTCSTSMTRGSSVNSTFIKTGVKITRTPKRSDKTTKSTEYFVEIFTKEKQNKAKHKPVGTKKRDDYSQDSLIKQTSDKSSSCSSEQSTSSEKSLMETSADSNSIAIESQQDISVNEMLRQIQSDTLESHNTNDRRLLSADLVKCENVFPEKTSSIESSPEEVIFDKTSISTHEKIDEPTEEDDADLKEPIQSELGQRFEKTLPENTLSFVKVSGVPLSRCSDIDERNSSTQLLSSRTPYDTSSADMLCSVTSQDLITSFQCRSVSVDNIPLRMADYITTPSISKKLSKSFDSIEECKEPLSQNVLTSNPVIVDKELTLHENVSPTKDEEVLSIIAKQEIDVVNSIDISANMFASSSSNDLKTCNNILPLSISTDAIPSNELNRTFVINELNCHEQEYTKFFRKPTQLSLGELSSISGDKDAKSPDKHRRQWGNSIEGLDHILIPSLEAFSLELRTTAESLAAKIRVLYEVWQAKHDDIEGDDVPSTKADLQKPVLENNSQGGEQKEIAVAFRNLRKVEVKLKTMEQAAAAMIKSLEEDDQKGESSKKTIQRAKSFKWKELQHTARHQMRSKDWHTRNNSKIVSDEGSDSDA